MNYPLVTIVAISYNQEKFVIDSLNSIKGQTYPNIQLIIADDGSKDGTKKLIENWIIENNSSAIFLNHPVNMGVTKNLNSALPYIKGEYYQFLGCEDEMMPNKIAKQVQLLQQNKQFSIVYSDMQRMSPNGEVDNLTHYQALTYNIPRSGDLYKHLIERCFVATPTALMKIEVLEEIGGDNENMEINDHDFWMRASKKFKFLYDASVTMKYRVMPESLSNKQGIIKFKNRFLLYYFNYDKREEYRDLFNSKIMFNAKNLFALRYKKSTYFFLKAFFKTGIYKLLILSIRSLPFYFTGNE